MSDEHKSEEEHIEVPDTSRDAPVRATVELPRVVLGSSESAREAPHARVLPGRVDARWLIYSAYITCFLAAGVSINFAIDSGEWAVGPVIIGWAMLYIWQWIYGVAYRYRRSILKYSAALMVVALTALLAGVCFDRAPAQLVIASGELLERASVARLKAAAALTIFSGLLILAHVTVLGRGYRRIKQRDTTAD